jgi:hypothetical protein
LDFINDLIIVISWVTISFTRPHHTSCSYSNFTSESSTLWNFTSFFTVVFVHRRSSIHFTTYLFVLVALYAVRIQRRSRSYHLYQAVIKSLRIKRRSEIFMCKCNAMQSTVLYARITDLIINGFEIRCIFIYWFTSTLEMKYPVIQILHNTK